MYVWEKAFRALKVDCASAGTSMGAIGTVAILLWLEGHGIDLGTREQATELLRELGEVFGHSVTVTR